MGSILLKYYKSRKELASFRRLRIWGSGFRVPELGFSVGGLWVQSQSSGVRVQMGLGFRGLGFRGLGFRVQGFGFRVSALYQAGLAGSHELIKP